MSSSQRNSLVFAGGMSSITLEIVFKYKSDYNPINYITYNLHPYFRIGTGLFPTVIGTGRYLTEFKHKKSSASQCKIPITLKKSIYRWLIQVLGVLSCLFVCLFSLGWPRTYYIDQPSLELVEIPCLCLLGAGIKGMSHCEQKIYWFYKTIDKK